MGTRTLPGIQPGITSVRGFANTKHKYVHMHTSTQKIHLGIYTDDTVPIYNSIYAELFAVALHVTAKSGKLPTSLLTEEWASKLWHVCTVEYYKRLQNIFIN